MIALRNVEDADYDAILELNDAEVQQTSAMDADRLRQLVRLSAYCKVAVIDDRVAGFVIALREGVPYENDNYAWFASRFPRFLYVDRIVVGAGFTGLGIGSRLYLDLFEFARAHDAGTITCEYNLQPPNPASRAFHDRFGFRELGRQWLAGGAKQVSLQAVEL